MIEPDEPNDSPGPLLLELKRLWLEAGKPSVRVISQKTGGRVSHSTVHTLLQGSSQSRWETIAAVGMALDADLERLRELWNADPTGAARGRAGASIDGLTDAINNLADAIRELHTHPLADRKPEKEVA